MEALSVWAHNASEQYGGPTKWQSEFDALPDVSRNGRSLKQRYLQHLADEGANAKSPSKFAKINLRNWENADRVSFELQARQAAGAPIGKGSKPTKTGNALPDFPVDEVFEVPIQGGGTARIRGVTDAKDRIYIRPEIDKHGYNQLTEMFNHAQSRRLPFNLIISPRTQKISAKAADFVRRRRGMVLEFNPDTGTWTRINIGRTRGQPWKRN